MAAIRIEEVHFQYASQVALQQVSLHIPTGTFAGLLGPNGGGKTTLFRLLSTLLAPDAGIVEVMGYDTVRQAHQVRQQLGVIFQHPALDDDLTVQENLEIHAALYGLSPRKVQDRMHSLAHDFGIADRMRHAVKTLSGGLKRRVDLVRGLLHSPPVLLLDEPTTGLDPAARRACWDVLARHRRKEGTTMLVATHLMEEADTCDQVAIIDQGRIVAQGSPTALKEQLGASTLWIEANDPDNLCDLLHARFPLQASIIGHRVQVSHDNVHTLLPSLYEQLGDHILSATTRKPTLEDVFLVHTGHTIL